MATQDQVIAVVSPRSVGQTSIFETDQRITPDNVADFHSTSSDTEDAARELKRLGFNILDQNPTTISIGGSAKLFQDVFGTKLEKGKKEVVEGEEVDIFSVPGPPEAQVLAARGELAPLIEGVAITEPPELFESPIPPLAEPDASAYRYMMVPDELSTVLRATRVHRLGATGKGVIVGMIDTGHYRHPYFVWHGFRVLTTLLGPGQSDPASDMVGHGTGESANIFAAAPDVRLRPIKGLIDPVGDFNVAVTSVPKPQILSNSWGYNIDFPSTTLTPYQKLLEAAVANAIAAGIVVCFSAGNVKKRGFPASHPDVIAVGGVHVNFPYESDADLEASTYASSFDSSLYPGRHVPDVSGLTGKAVKINGATRAPSLMLPVQPGSSLDGISPTTGSGSDGWGLFSGTSAACPQVAGVAAIMVGKDPTIAPADVKTKLMMSARDVKKGKSSSGDGAGPGWDPATGAGLVDAKWSYLIAMGDVAAEFFEAPRDQQLVMLESGQMPELPREFVADLIDTLRSV